MRKKIVIGSLILLGALIIWHGLTPKNRGAKKVSFFNVQLDLSDAPKGCHYDLEFAQWIDCDCRSTLTDCAWFYQTCNIGGCLIVDGACGSSGNLQCLGRCKDRF